jgi:hypothetical protein
MFINNNLIAASQFVGNIDGLSNLKKTTHAICRL